MLKLIEFDYIENKGLPNEWAIENCVLETINLFAGKNSTGKSRILKSLHLLAMILCKNIEVVDLSKTVEGSLVFSETESKDRIELFFSIAKGVVTSESLSINDAAGLVRNLSGAVKIIDDRIDIENDDQQVDPTSLAVYELSFKCQFLGIFVDWATCFCCGLHSFVIPQAINSPEAFNVFDVFTKGNSTDPKYKKAVLIDMAKVGYTISHLELKDSILQSQKSSIVDLYGVPVCFFVREGEKDIDTEQPEMSKGMFRVLVTLIKVNYLLLVCARTPSCFTVDDLGEGLDPKCATRLTKLLFEKFATSEFQLVIATNNEYVMNAVPIEHWSLMERSPNGVRFKNRHNSQEEIEVFDFLGLNNFDYFRQSQD